MADKTDTTATVEVKPLISDAQVKSCVKAGRAFDQGQRGSTLDKFRADITDHVTAHAVIRPIYDVANAAWRKREGKAATDNMSASSLVTVLETRMQAIEKDPTAHFPLNAGQVRRIIDFTGDQAEHTKNERAYLAYCVEQKVAVRISTYVKWLEMRAENYVDDQGRWTDAGQAKLDADADAENAVEYRNQCGQSFDLMLDGASGVVKLAWARAAIHDLEHLVATLTATLSVDDRRKANDLLAKAKKNGSVVSYIAAPAADTVTV